MSTRTFLEELAEDIYNRYGKELHNLQLLFPNKRVPLFFLKALSKHIDPPSWAPSVSSLEDFLYSGTGYEKPEKLSLLITLYKIHKELWEEKNRKDEHIFFDSFSFWGEVILRDFEEIDASMLEAEKIFVHVEALKDVETKFSFLDESHRAIAKRFWSHFLQDTSKRKTNFTKFWQTLPYLYNRLRTELSVRRQAYPGLLQRIVAEHPNYYPQLLQKRLIFVGFNFLSKAEQTFVRYAVAEQKAEVHWDLDAFYIENANHEAGHFLRRYQKDAVLSPTFPNILPKRERPPKLHVHTVSSPVSQAKAAATKLHDYLESYPKKPPERTAIVLPQEYMLLPLLHTIPNCEANITMGYRLSATPLRDLVQIFLSLDVKEGSISLSEWRLLLEHPYVSVLCPSLPEVWRPSLATERKKLQSNDKELLQYPDFLVKAVFSEEDLLKRLKRLAEGLQVEATTENSSFNRLEQAYLSTFSHMLDTLEKALSKEGLEEVLDTLTPRSQKRLLESLLHMQQLTFTGEPLKGVQITGILETHNLDFDCLIVMDMNEGSWPPSLSTTSLLPQQLRRAYGLPTHRDQDANYAYIFYRLLQRSCEVHLFYLSSDAGEATGVEKKQKSRFLYQLEYDYPNAQLEEVPLQHHIRIKKTNTVSIAKSEELLQQWKVRSRKHTSDYALSVSALNDYLYCPLHFYYKQMLGLLPKPSSVSQQRLDFGKLFHKSMEILYKPLLHQRLDEERLNTAKEEAPNLIHRLLAKTYGLEPKSDLNGEPRILYAVLLRYVNRVIALDQQRSRKFSNLCVRYLEQPLNLRLSLPTPTGECVFYVWGRADRIDEADGTYHILDYKTSKDRPKFVAPSEIFCNDPEGKNAAVRQLALYAWMCSSTFRKESKAMLLSLPNLHNQPPELHSYVEKELRESLLECLREILDTKKPFSVTNEEQKSCKYCPFGSLCCQ